MAQRPVPFVPALGYAVLTPLYDWAVRLGTPEQRIRSWLRNQVGPASLLDFGCGTGAFLSLFPTEQAEGIDADPHMVGVCWKKHLRVHLAQTTTLPFPDGHFSAVTSTWVFQHFGEEEARHYFREVRRVLAADGCFWLGDWGPPLTPAQRLMTRVTRAVDRTQNGFGPAGLWPGWLKESGFAEVTVAWIQPTLLGTFYAWRCLPEAQKDMIGAGS